MSDHAVEAVHHTGEAAHHAAAGVHGALGKKLGPMPVGGWILAVGAGVVVALYFRNKGTTDPATPDPTTIPDLTGADGFDQADPGGTLPTVGGSAGGGTTTGGGGTTTGGGGVHKPTEAQLARAATTNAQWATHSVAAMVPFGFDAHHVANALDAFLTGKKLTPGQEVALAATEARCGPPPHTPAKQAPPGNAPSPKPPHDGIGGGSNGHVRHDNGTTPPTKPAHHK